MRPSALSCACAHADALAAAAQRGLSLTVYNFALNKLACNSEYKMDLKNTIFIIMS